MALTGQALYYLIDDCQLMADVLRSTILRTLSLHSVYCTTLQQRFGQRLFFSVLVRDRMSVTINH